jgi:hypothetical protein
MVQYGAISTPPDQASAYDTPTFNIVYQAS